MNTPREYIVSADNRLIGVYGKINRAVEHLDDLDGWFEGWLKQNPWSVETETDEDGIAKRLYFSLRCPIPERVGLIVGDIIHNLRCALDHLAVAEAKLYDRGPKGVWFPIEIDQNAYEEMRAEPKRNKLRKCSTEFGNFIDTLQPYKGGNDVLYSLHHLDIIDKHRVLVPVGTTKEVTVEASCGLFGALDFEKADSPVRIKFPEKSTFVKDGDTVLSFSSGTWWFPKGAEITTESALTVAFGDDTPVPGQELRDTLITCLEAVEKIVLDAEKRFFH